MSSGAEKLRKDVFSLMEYYGSQSRRLHPIWQVVNHLFRFVLSEIFVSYTTTERDKLSKIISNVCTDTAIIRSEVKPFSS